MAPRTYVLVHGAWHTGAEMEATATHLRAEGVPLGWLPVARGVLLAVGIIWSGWLGMRLLFDRAPNARQAAMALPGLVLPLAAVGAAWIHMFFVW